MTSKLNFIEVASSHAPETLSAVVADGLARPQKSLPCRLFYDSTGSHLFERICELPEYYLTRTEHRILSDSADAMAASVGNEVALIEFGSGSSCKTRLLMDALLARQDRLHYVPIDISREFLRASALTLLSEYDRLTVTAVAAEYDDSLPALPSHAGPRLFLFLGSNIGNFTHLEAIDFLARLRQRMQSQDRLLIGVDLRKDPAIIEAAYNDALGVTAAFNKNLLARINAELGADFDLDRFEHAAPFVAAESRIEMRLISRCRQTVRLPSVDKKFAFEAGEFIHTENSHKYTLAGFAALCKDACLEIQNDWLDPQAWFAVVLLRPRNL